MINPYEFEDPFDITNTSTDSLIENPEKPNLFKRIKKALPIVPYAINAGASYNQEVRDTEIYENSMRNRFQQKPILDLNNMYGDNQQVIKAENGAEIRTNGHPSMPVNIEGGEFLILADGTTEIAKGKSHAKGGINTILPDKSIVYSNKLKPSDSKKTFAEIAKKYDYTKEVETLGNPYSSPIAKNSAERMLSRKKESLKNLYQEQQFMNNDSNGEVMENGGKMEYESGGEYDLDEKEIKRLQKLGYKIEIL